MPRDGSITPRDLRSDARLRADPRGDGGIREELAAGVRHVSFGRYSGMDQSAGLTRSVAKTDRAMEAWYHPSIA
jgi:hypothetical protein